MEPGAGSRAFHGLLLVSQRLRGMAALMEEPWALSPVLCRLLSLVTKGGLTGEPFPAAWRVLSLPRLCPGERAGLLSGLPASQLAPPALPNLRTCSPVFRLPPAPGTQPLPAWPPSLLRPPQGKASE